MVHFNIESNKYYQDFQYNNIGTKKISILNQLIEIAHKSVVKHKHSACLVHNRKIIQKQCNIYTLNNCSGSYTYHAEEMIYRKINKKKFNYNVKYDLWVIRFSNYYGFRNSKPCCHCLSYIKKNMPYVKNIIYTTDNKLYKIDISHINNNYISLGNRLNIKK
jgi:cytidine deaminase